MRHLCHQRLGQAQETAATGGGFTPGERNLSGDALTLVRRGNARLGLGASLVAVKCRGNPCLQAGYG